MREGLALAVWTFVLGGGALAISIGVYAGVSFALMRPHTAARPFGDSAREFFRETLLAAVTQPFLPLYYLVGYRMEPFGGPLRRGASGTPVVFVHGYMQNRSCFLGLARAFAAKGIGPLYAINYPWFDSIGANAKRLERFIVRVCKETGSPVVDLVCHSAGGLVAMEMLRCEARAEDVKVRRCVTIATPHAGIQWRGPLIGFGATSMRRGSKLLETHAGYTLTVPALSIFSTHDNLVHPKETSQLAKRGGRDVEVDGLAHLAILYSKEVADHAASFLREPAANPAAARASLDGEGGPVPEAAQVG
jgi:pimeloyl-ACP methyl ester carboxylesterase